MDSLIVSSFGILFGIFMFIIYQAWKVNQFWMERGIPHVKPWLFLGNSAPLLLIKKSAIDHQKEICEKFPNEPVVGFYYFMKPVLLVNNVEMIEKILIQDFIHFTDHGFVVDENRNHLDSNLLTMNGKRWKACRNKLARAFTTGKLKMMFNCMQECGDELVAQLRNYQEVEMRDFLGRYAMDVSASCLFGIETKNLSNPENDFHHMGRKVFQIDIKQFLKLVLTINFPSIIKFFTITFNKPNVIKFFAKIIDDTVKHRREHGCDRIDFVQLMMQIQDKGYVDIHNKHADGGHGNIDETSNLKERFEISKEQVIGNAYTFLTAGFEGVALVTMYTLYEISKNTRIQEKLREEIQKNIETSGALTYDCLREMNYLEQCIKETLRKYPPVQMIFRVCTKEYKLPNGTKIEPNQSLLISINTLHRDTRYYPEPDQYVPERFDPVNRIPLGSYIPFGNGPRMCIAMRFAMLEMKSCLAKLLMNYTFNLSPKTREPLTISARNFLTTPNETDI